MGKRFMAIIMGLIAGFIVIMLVEKLGHVLYPLPEGMNYKDPEQLKAYIATAPTMALVMVLIAHIVGVFIAALVATKIDPTTVVPAYFIGVLFLVAGVAQLYKIRTHHGCGWIYWCICPVRWLGGRWGGLLAYLANNHGHPWSK